MNDIVAHQKQFLRGYFHAAVRALPAAQRRREALAAARRMSQWPTFRRAQTVALYLPLAHEFDVRPLAALCRQNKKILLLPRVEPALRRLHFHRWQGGNLEANVYGILEPAANADRFLPEDLDLVVVPGAAFTPSGRRLGSGGGYYDRFLAAHPRLKTVGAAYSCQLTPRLPREKFDRPVSAVLTAARLFA